MNRLKYFVACAALVVAMNTATQAQMMVDMSKFTCGQLLGGSPDAVEAAIWMSGYYNGLRKNTMLDLNVMKHNGEATVAACKGNPNKTIMEIVDSLREKKQ